MVTRFIFVVGFVLISYGIIKGEYKKISWGWVFLGTVLAVGSVILEKI